MPGDSETIALRGMESWVVSVAFQGPGNGPEWVLEANEEESESRRQNHSLSDLGSKTQLESPIGTSFLTGGQYPGIPVLSPDGAYVAFTARDDKGKAMLCVRPVSSLTAQPMASTEGASFPFWSPDSRWVGFFNDGKLRKVEATGGPAQALCDAPAPMRSTSEGALHPVLPAARRGRDGRDDRPALARMR